MKEFNSKKARDEFGGFNSETAGAPSFEVRVSLPHTLYNDKEQGYSPLETLVGSMFGHAYSVSEHNNGGKMLIELNEMRKEYSKPEYFKNIVTEINFDFKEPLNKILFSMIVNEIPEDVVKQKLEQIKKNRNKPRN